MSNIDDVKAAEKKVGEILAALKSAAEQCPKDLSTELKDATDDYVRAVRELRVTCRRL